ncbi:MAG: Allergen V5/Tpx family protein [Polaromonas sp.]|nr:Allergen V5/Tpx family protein [Polaromonas sp.]
MNTLFSRNAIRQASAGIVPGLALVALLSACGGSDNDAPAASAAPAPAAVPDAPNPSTVTALPGAPSHPAGSEELAAFNLLNAERSRCGFGLLADSAPLNAAARAHADYLIINSISSHLEDQAQYPEGFTGTDPEARIKAQGYPNPGGVTDEFALFSASAPVLPKQGLGELGVRGLLNAPYHLNGLMSGYRDVGMAVRTNADTGKGARVAVVQINAAYQASAGPQQLGSSDVQTYPCEGTTGVNRQLTNESPNPVPGRDLRASPLGTSVYIAAREGSRLAIGSAAMALASTGQAVSLRPPVTGANDPYGPCASGCFRQHQAYVVPNAPLQPGSAYSVTISGTSNGQPFSRSFTFTTGS